MGVELDLSELAVLRPIQTTAAAATTTARPAGSGGAADGPDAAAADITGCVTPTARPAGDDAAADGPDAADTGCVTPTAAMTTTSSALLLLPFLDIDPAAAAVAACVTPTASPCLLRPATECPPAPRKPAARPAAPPENKRKRCCLQRVFFPVPHDLSTVFVPRGPVRRGGPADRSPPPPPPAPSPSRPAAKKIRLHVVG